MTLHPLDPSDSARIRKYKRGFWFLIAAAIGLVISQGVRNGLSQELSTKENASLHKEIQAAHKEIQAARSDQRASEDKIAQLLKESEKEQKTQSTVVEGIHGLEQGQIASSKRTPQVSEKTFRITQRAWLVAESMGETPLEPDKNIVAVVTLRNNGKSLASNVFGHLQINIQKTSDPEPTLDMGSLTEKPIANCAVIGPAGAAALRQPTVPLNSSQIDGINDGALKLYSYGLFSYDDIWNVHHHYAFCFVFDKESGWHFCTRDNKSID